MAPKLTLSSSLAWMVLIVPLIVLLFASASKGRGDWPDLLPGEATHLTQALSLVEDHDLLYTRLDFDRILLAWRGNPPDLELSTASPTRRMTFATLPAYAIFLAPFLAIAPERGFAVANALLLLIAAVVAALVFTRRLGLAAPLSLAVLIFGSVIFQSVFAADAVVFYFSLALLAFAALLSLEPGRSEGGRRLFFAGLILATLVMAKPLWAVIVPSVVLLLPAPERRRLLQTLVAGFVAGLGIWLLISFWNGGGLHFFATSKFRFTPLTGYPLVDFPAERWTEELRRLEAIHFDGAARFSWGLEPRLWFWNLVYLLTGRHLGLLCYFLPFFLVLGLSRERRRPVLLGLALFIGTLMLLQPFTLAGMGLALGNSLFVPVAAVVLTLLPGLGDRWQALRSRFGDAGAALAWVLLPLLAVAPFLLPAWRDPGAYPLLRGPVQRFVSPAAKAFLPFELSQRWLPSGQVQEHQGLLLRPLDEHVWVETQRDRLGMDAEAPARLVLCSARPIRRLTLEFDSSAQSELEIRGGALGATTLRADGGISFEIIPQRVRRHALWLGPTPLYLYSLEIAQPKAAPGDLFFRIVTERS